MASIYLRGCAEYYLPTVITFERLNRTGVVTDSWLGSFDPFRVGNGRALFRGLRGVPLAPGYYL
jgi:hypothetical protein